MVRGYIVGESARALEPGSERARETEREREREREREEERERDFSVPYSEYNCK